MKFRMLNAWRRITVQMSGTVACSAVGERNGTLSPGVPELIFRGLKISKRYHERRVCLLFYSVTWRC
jgi:hypothetical protein